ncbi:MAG: primosomal replication protein N [Betaproteobacteria bacterium]
MDAALPDDEGGEVQVDDGRARRRRGEARRGEPCGARASLNRLEISGKVVELGALRYTPAGVPAVEFKLAHESEQPEAGGRRKVQAEIGAIAFETQARLMAQARLNSRVSVQGFLAARSKRSRRLVLHVTNIEFLEGDGDASAS